MYADFLAKLIKGINDNIFIKVTMKIITRIGLHASPQIFSHLDCDSGKKAAEFSRVKKSEYQNEVRLEKIILRRNRNQKSHSQLFKSNYFISFPVLK